jgi:hypothetical protein
MAQISFSADVRPLFRAIDISHMKPFGVELDSYTYMSNPDNANKVLATLCVLTSCRLGTTIASKAFHQRTSPIS